VGLVYAGVNAFLVGGHLWRHRDDPARLDALAQRLEAEQVEIAALEAQLTMLAGSLERQEASIQQLGFRIQNVQLRYPDGVPSDRYAEYTADVERYNAEIRAYNDGIARYERLGQQYSARVDAFNQLAQEANALALQVKDIPHLLPVDLSSRIVSN
jgi:cell division protein FtsB